MSARPHKRLQDDVPEFKMKWPLVTLGEVLTKSDSWVRITPDKSYKQVTVRLWGQGVVLRNEVKGSAIAGSRRLLVKPKQFIVSRIDARNGAFGLIPDSLAGAVVTNDFPVFELDKQKIVPEYIKWLSKTNDFVELCKVASEGTTNRVRLKENRFLESEIFLPPLSEQRRIVAKIEELGAKIEEARENRKRIIKEIDTLLSATKHKVFTDASSKGWKSYGIHEVAPINMGQSPPGESYNSVGEGMALLNGPTEFGSHHPCPVQWTNAPTKLCKRGDILLCVRGATTGRMNWADREYCIGRGLASLTPKSEICIPEFVYYFVQTQTQEMLARSAGSTFPNLPGEKLKTMEIPLPPLPTQRHIVEYLDNLQFKIDELKRHQTETQQELDALMPSILDKAFKGEL